jgi:hypothetical protein
MKKNNGHFPPSNFGKVLSKEEHIAPSHTEYYGELQVPQQNFGKIKTRQEVLIKFAGFPYQEFGAVKGYIEYIGAVPTKDGSFLAKVSLHDGLKTTYGHHLAFKTGMTASGEIITEDQRLLEKLFYQLRKVLNSRG